MKTILLLVLALACLAHTAFAHLSDLNQELLLAAQNGDFEATKTLLNRGADKDARDKDERRRCIVPPPRII
jgi:hypothetical protein